MLGRDAENSNPHQGAECRSLRESGKVIKEYDVEYFMISTDKLEDNTAFAKQENADFPILADPTQKTAT